MENNVKLELKNVEFSKSRFKTYYGNIGELIAEEVLLKDGFTVWGLKPYHAGIKVERGIFGSLYTCLLTADPSNGAEESRKLAIKELESFFGEKFNAFWKYMESMGVFGQVGIVGASRIHTDNKSKHVYTPDLIVKKGKEIYIVEVKANSGNIYLKPEKVQGLLSARKFGLIPLIVHINVTIKASDFSMQELR